MSRAWSGRAPQDITLDALAADELGPDDVRIHPDTLEHQAQVAEQHANPQLAANFRRAAELATLPDADVMSMYEALRPRRSTFDELSAIADSLEQRSAPLSAALVREAATVYQRRGLLR